MVIKREKLRRDLIRIQKEITVKRLSILFNGNVPLTDAEKTWLADVRNNFEISRKAEDFFYTFATFPSSNTPYLGNLIDIVNNIKVSRKPSSSEILFQNQTAKVKSCKKENLDYSPYHLKKFVKSDNTSYLASSPVNIAENEGNKESYDINSNSSTNSQLDFENELLDSDPKGHVDTSSLNYIEKDLLHKETENGISRRSGLQENGSLESRVLRNRELTDCNNNANISTSKEFMPGFYRRIFVK